MADKKDRCRNLRYKKPALASLGYDAMISELYEIQEICGDIHWVIDQGDETLLNALDGNEEDEWEFKMAFADVEAKVDQIMSVLSDYDIQEDYDTCTVALIGSRYRTVGYDDYEEDYFSLCGYERDLSTTEAGKRLMRKTKSEILMEIGQCVGIMVSFLDIRQQYDYIKATYDILKDENTSLLQTVKEIDQLYNAAAAEDFTERASESKRLDQLLETLPQKIWIE